MLCGKTQCTLTKPSYLVCVLRQSFLSSHRRTPVDFEAARYQKYHPLLGWLYIGSKGTRQSRWSKLQLVSTSSELGVPLEPSKLEGLAQCLVFLGIKVDTVALQLCLPQAKIQQLCEKLQLCIQGRSLTKRELQSLVGMLQFATKVVRPGRLFLCWL